MKRKNQKQHFPVIGLLCLFMTLLAMLTLPMAVGKYTAAGTGSASARVGKWDVHKDNSKAPTDSSGLMNVYSADGNPKTFSNVLAFSNYSEVMARLVPKLVVDSGTGSFTAAYTVTPAIMNSLTGSSSVAAAITSSDTGDSWVRCHLEIDAEQVD